MPIPLNAVTPSPEICVKCKGRLWCGPKCFILDRLERKKTTMQSINQNEIQSQSPPGVFVSWHGYPKVNFSPMAPATEPENKDSWVTDDTDLWFGKPAEEIINFRESLVRGNMKVEVNQAKDPDYDLTEVHETLMAKKPVDIEMKLKGAPRARALSFSDFHAPMGPQADLKKFSMTQNPSINSKIDYLYSDTDAKSLDAMIELYKADVGVNQLHKILSAGMLGVKKKRKFVPTRWSITAVDSQLSEHFVDEKIKYFSELGSINLFSSNYLKNYFYVILVPRQWSFELMEAWKPGSSWAMDAKEPVFTTDYEFYQGRKSYAENTAGGYYAVRIAIAEHLLKIKKQATALVFREIGSSGAPNLGVWKCRETVRDALKQKPLEFSELDLALKYVNEKMAIPINYWFKNSVILKEIKHQKRITDFF
tara:strand:- start:256 stop:1521 length:1266 start_codon:yes stop_codon:yes gene_type:complete